MTTHVREILEEAASAHEGEVSNLNERIAALETELKEAKENWQAEADAHADDNAFHEEALEALEAVKYWMHDVYVCGKPMSDPRKILRIVENAL